MSNLFANTTINKTQDRLSNEQDKLNKLIFGKDPTSHVVNVSVSSEEAHIFIEKDGQIVEETIKYHPWVLTNRPIATNHRRLRGDQYYKYINYLNYQDYINFTSKYQKDTFIPRTIEEGFMLLHGTSYFKKMTIKDTSILSFDIETLSLDPKASNAGVVLIANTFRRGSKVARKLFNIKNYKNDLDMIRDWCLWVQKINPSIILGHNVFGFDLPYLLERGKGLRLGRDGSDIIISSKPWKFRKDGQQQYDYNNMRIFGREIIDTFFLSIKYDLARNFPSYGLKAIIEHLGMEKKNRIKWDFNQWPVYKALTNDEQWIKFSEYAEDDSDDALKLYDLMIPSFFYLNQSIPKPFQQIINEATGSQLDAFMIRSYLQDGYSQPRTSQTKSFEGAISMGIPGNYKNVIKWDVASLYPSIMLNYKICNPSKDPNNHMIKALSYFREERLKDKKKAKETGDKYYNDLSDSRKIIINSLYGFMGANYLLYNYPDGAAEVTKLGREILQTAVKWSTGGRLVKDIKQVINKGKDNEEVKEHWVFEKGINDGKGFVLSNVDTDSISVTDGTVKSKEELNLLLNELNSLYPSLISWEDDGVFDNFLVIKAKNYVMKQGGKFKYKGSSIVDSKKEVALKEMLYRLCEDLMITDGKNMLDIYHSYVKEVCNMKDINRWTVKKTITKAILESSRLNESKVRDALDLTTVQEGDKVWLFTAIDGVKTILDKDGNPKKDRKGNIKTQLNQVLRQPSGWTGSNQDIEHYLQRVHATVKILENVLDISQFLNYTKKDNQKKLQEILKNDN